MGREIELKIKITEPQLKLLKRYLKKNAEFKGREHHLEYYLDNPNNSSKFKNKQGFLDASKFLRVRMTPKGNSICLKTFKTDNKGDSENTGEFETNVDDAKESLELFRNLGYTDETIIDKTREKYLLEKYEIVIDSVKRLGIFVEVELLEEVDDIRNGWKTIRNFLKDIGINKFEEQQRGYVAMFWNPGFEFGKKRNL